MKRMMWTIMAIFAAAIMLPAMAETNSEIEALKARLAALEAQQVETYDNVSRLVRSEVVALQDEMAFAAMHDAGVVSLAKADKLKISGDLRLRYEVVDYEDKEAVAPAKEDFRDDELRYRFRLGLTWQDEDFEVGFRLDTGGDGADTSRNQTAEDMSTGYWGGAWGTYPVSIGLMYAKHTWEMEDAEVSLTLGKMKNPFVSSFMPWDSDLTPEGAALQAEMGMMYGTLAALITGDPDRTDEAVAALYAIQVGLADKLDNFDYNVALGYYFFNNPNTNRANSTAGGAPASPFGFPNDDYEVEIGQFYGEINTKMEDVKLGAFFDIWRNFGADGLNGQGANGLIGTEKADDNDTGWVLGVKGAWEKFKAMYAYGHVENESTNSDFWDSDFMDGNAGGGVKGHEFTIAYQALKNMSIGLDVIMTSEIESDNNPTSGDEWEETIYQLDLQYKF